MVGVDEVGRGCWAGPMLVVAAKEKAELPAGLKDSKLLTKNQKVKLLNMLSSCCLFGEGWVNAREIDRLGLGEALRLGIRRALKELKASTSEQIILDGKINYVQKRYNNATAVIDADNLIPIVSAASVYAKVTRDKFMAELAKKYPAYSFDRHVGYGTQLHKRALMTYGPIKNIHRFSYRPVSELARIPA